MLSFIFQQKKSISKNVEEEVFRGSPRYLNQQNQKRKMENQNLEKQKNKLKLKLKRIIKS